MDELDDIINKMKEAGQISFERPRMEIFVSKCKASDKPAKSRSTLLMVVPYMPIPPLETVDFGVN